MFDRFPAEIFYYSIIPVCVIALIALVILMIKKKKDENYYKKSYVIKVSLILIVTLVLPLITGYTIWLLCRYINKGVLLSNLGFVIVLSVLIVANLTLLIVISRKLYKNIVVKA